MHFLHDLRFAARSLARARGVSLAVALTLALGIGANVAMFSVVRGVLLRPLANREESRLIYIRQSAPGIGVENTTFSIPEIRDLRSGLTSVTAIGEFSLINPVVVGLGEPRTVRAGVVDGNYFPLMGLQPTLGRLLTPSDDGPNAGGAVVLMHRFWATSLEKDPTVIGRTIRLGSQPATIVGVLEPSVPYPAETELIANMATSPHHLSATMVAGREHRMTEIFGRLSPGADLESVRAELGIVHHRIIAAHPAIYRASADFRIDAVLLRDQITSRAQTVLLLLLAASALIFLISCSNVVNLILARTIRRESELAIRSALGASTVRLRQTLLAESVLLCGTGAVLGVAIAGPMVTVLARYATRFSVRARDLTLDTSLLWVGAALAVAAAMALAFVPRLPSRENAHGLGQSIGGVRVTSAQNRRLRAFAVTQIAASFVLLVGAGMLVNTLLELHAKSPGFDTRVLAVNVPVVSFGRTPEQMRGFYREVQQRLQTLPGVDRVAIGSAVPWRDTVGLGNEFAFSVEGHVPVDGENDPQGRFRRVSPGFFEVLGIPLLAGRDFTHADRLGAERVVIVSALLAQRLFPGQDPLNRHLMWTDGVMKFIGIAQEPRRIVGVVADVDDEHAEPRPTMTIYHPFEQELGGGRVFVRARSDPYGLVPSITKTVRDLAADQPIERASTLEDVRAEVLAPTRLNAIVFGGFATVALCISIVGVGGVLAFSVSARTREFGIRMAIGSRPGGILAAVLGEGAAIAAIGILAGGVGGFTLSRLVGTLVPDLQLPGLLPALASGSVLLGAAAIASLLPAARAARVDVMEALRRD